MADDVHAQGAQSSETFQKRVLAWLLECFSMEICRDGVERNHRFLEEALELVQSLGCTKSEAYQLVDYVFGRPAGEPDQELGGVQVTLAALCFPHDLDMRGAAERELARVWTKIDKIRAKQAAKPKHSPLPEHPAERADASIADGLREIIGALDPFCHISTPLAVIQNQAEQLLARCSSPAEMDREKVAHIIDPGAHFKDIEGVTWSKHEIQRRELAYQKADAILALRSQPENSAQQVALAALENWYRQANQLHSAKLYEACVDLFPKSEPDAQPEMVTHAKFMKEYIVAGCTGMSVSDVASWVLNSFKVCRK